VGSMTEAESQRLVAILFTSFASQLGRLGDQQLADTQRAYRRFLADLTFADAEAAVARIVQTSRFMPTIAEIRDAVLTVRTGDVRPGGDAWGDVRRAISRWGSYRVPGVDFNFADETVHRCVAALGWDSLCSSENETADRARFVQLYDQLAKQSRSSSAASPGLAAGRSDALRLVGDVANAIAVKP